MKLDLDVIGTNTGQNFEPDLSMTVPRPYEANLGRKKFQNNFLEVAEKIGSKIGRGPVRPGFPAGRGSQTGGWGGQERAN